MAPSPASSVAVAVVVALGCSLRAPNEHSLQAGPAADAISEELGDWVDEPPGRIGPPDLRIEGGLVIDRATGLEWQRAVGPLCSLGQADAACAALIVDAKSGFRLPTRSELLTIVDLDAWEPSIVKEFTFPLDPDAGAPDAELGPRDFFWTSTPSVGAGGSRWTVQFYDGVAARRLEGVLPVRCVRGGKAHSGPRFAIEGGDVLDTRTGLRWRTSIEVGLFDMATATETCKASGYRLPTELELESIVDTRRRSPAVDPIFGRTPRETFWSSTNNAGLAWYGWAVSFETGEAVYANRDSRFRVRCVR